MDNRRVINVLITASLLINCAMAVNNDQAKRAAYVGVLEDLLLRAVGHEDLVELKLLHSAARLHLDRVLVRALSNVVITLATHSTSSSVQHSSKIVTAT